MRDIGYLVEAIALNEHSMRLAIDAKTLIHPLCLSIAGVTRFNLARLLLRLRKSVQHSSKRR